MFCCSRQHVLPLPWIGTLGSEELFIFSGKPVDCVHFPIVAMLFTGLMRAESDGTRCVLLRWSGARGTLLRAVKIARSLEWKLIAPLWRFAAISWRRCACCGNWGLGNCLCLRAQITLVGAAPRSDVWIKATPPHTLSQDQTSKSDPQTSTQFVRDEPDAGAKRFHSSQSLHFRSTLGASQCATQRSKYTPGLFSSTVAPSPRQST